MSDVGPSPMLLMVHVPVDIGSHDLIHFIGNYEPKLESIKIIRDQTKDQYMVLLKFIEQEIADKFYHSINGIQFNSLLEEKCQLAYVAKVEQLHPSEGAGQGLGSKWSDFEILKLCDSNDLLKFTKINP